MKSLNEGAFKCVEEMISKAWELEISIVKVGKDVYKRQPLYREGILFLPYPRRSRYLWKMKVFLA